MISKDQVIFKQINWVLEPLNLISQDPFLRVQYIGKLYIRNFINLEQGFINLEYNQKRNQV